MGKLELGGKPIDSSDAVAEIIAECGAQQFEFLEIAAEHASLAPSLKGDHKDSFDRMLTAQAARQGLRLVSADAVFDRFVPRIDRFWPGSPAVPGAPGQARLKKRPPKAVKKARS